MQYSDVCAVAANAWEQTKDKEDPSFNGCSYTHRDNLVAIAEAVIRTRSATTDFEKAVLGILDAMPAAAPAVADAKPAKKPRSRKARK
jgi:hypothetical protein